MTNKILDFAFPITGGAGGSIFAVITFSDMAQTAVSAAIFAIVGGIIGLILKKASDVIFKKKG